MYYVPQYHTVGPLVGLWAHVTITKTVLRDYIAEPAGLWDFPQPRIRKGTMRLTIYVDHEQPLRYFVNSTTLFFKNNLHFQFLLSRLLY